MTTQPQPLTPAAQAVLDAVREWVYCDDPGLIEIAEENVRTTFRRFREEQG